MSEIYGLSETSGPMTWTPFRVHVGTVGPPIPGCEVVLADDGEVLARGGNIFRGYLNDPERTAEALDDDGWLHSGDIGEFDADGYLKIVDRKKELIITAGGKNISPANLEAALKSFPLIGQACVIGDNRPFISALLVLDPEVAPPWAANHGIEGKSLAELAEDPIVLDEVRRNVDEANAALRACRADQEVRAARRGVAPRLRGAHPDDEAEAAGRPHEVRGPDRGHVRLSTAAMDASLTLKYGVEGRIRTTVRHAAWVLARPTRCGRGAPGGRSRARRSRRRWW